MRKRGGIIIFKNNVFADSLTRHLADFFFHHQHFRDDDDGNDDVCREVTTR